MQTLSRPADDEIAYRDYERSVLAMLATRYCDLDPDGRRELYQEAWASVLKRRSDGADIENLRSYLMGAADKLASKRIYGADARRRQTFDPTSEGFVALAGTSEPPEERVLAEDEARRLHMLIDELEEADRALLKLRLDLGLDPPEIRERLGLSDRQYRRIAERAGKALLAQFRAFDRGDWARGKRSLLCACVMGIASEKQRRRAQHLVENDPCCRAMMNELRELGGGAAAILPVPVGTLVAVGDHTGPAERILEVLSGLKGRAADLADTRETMITAKRHVGEAMAGAKQHAATAYMRAADPTPLTGARPGTAVALVASCVAAGGGAYCAVEGVPDPIRPVMGVERSQADSKSAPPRQPAQAGPQSPAPPVLPTPAPEPAPAEKPAVQQPAQPPATAPPAAAPPAAPPPAPRDEFEPSAQPASPEPPTSSPSASRAPVAPAPTSGGSGEFGP